MADDEFLYRLTSSPRIPEIREKGISIPPASAYMRKTPAGELVRYQDEPALFAFDNPESAILWAKRMKWKELMEDPKSSSIIKFKRGEGWEEDPSDDPNLFIGCGKDKRKASLRKKGHVKPENIVEVFNIPPALTEDDI